MFNFCCCCCCCSVVSSSFLLFNPCFTICVPQKQNQPQEHKNVQANVKKKNHPERCYHLLRRCAINSKIFLSLVSCEMCMQFFFVHALPEKAELWWFYLLAFLIVSLQIYVMCLLVGLSAMDFLRCHSTTERGCEILKAKWFLIMIKCHKFPE